MIQRFCPKCGKETNALIKGFCRDCFLHDHKLIVIPKEIELEHCKNCNKIRIKGNWVEQSKIALEDFVASKVKVKDLVDEKISVELTPLEDETTIASIIISGEFDGNALQLSEEIVLKPRTVLCDECMKASSYYHEAIVQVRYSFKPDEKTINSDLNEIKKVLDYESKKDSLAVLIDVIKQSTGFDVLIGSKHSGRHVAEHLAKKHGTKVVSSHKLIGVDKSGKEKKRFTFCVRM